MAKKYLQRFNLHDALNSRAFDHAVICTFTFDAIFFEEYCLEKFRSLTNNGNITVFVDRGIYEEILSGAESTKPKRANLRYLLFPVSVPGVFHPKLFLFTSKNKGKLFVGSANFTRSGLTQNAEMVASFDYESEKDEVHVQIFQQAFRYLLELGASLKSKSVDSNLQEIARDAEWLVQDPVTNEDKPISFLSNLTENLWMQFIAGIAPPVDSVLVLSRYFDGDPSFLNIIENDLNPSRIQIYTQNGVTNLTPIWLEHPLVRNGKAEIFLCNYLDDGFPQHLHAKALAVQKGDNISLAYGSANFTSSALLRTSAAGNMEVLLKIPNISKRKFKPAEFFDPENSAIPLIDGSVLQNSLNDEEELVKDRIVHPIRLYEAEVKQEGDEDIIAIRADVPIDLRFQDLQCRLLFNNQASRTSKLNHKEADNFFASTNEGIKRRINEESTILSIESLVGTIWINQSNSILLTNLKDIKTDNPVRRERFVKEAQQSSVQFFSVLRELLESGDQQALLTFLNFCDIPINSYPRPRFAIAARPVWDGEKGMRKLGGRNLKIYIELHPAAMAFFDRHLKKLKRHVESRSVNGIENFLHIFLAMGGILRSQADRVVSGIESKGSAISNNEWADCRNHIDIYFGKFKELMNCLWNEYLSALIREYPRTQVSERFLPDLDAINNLSSDMLSCRERVETVRIRDLTRMDHFGVVKSPGYFHCIFKAEKWAKYSFEMETKAQKIEQSVLLAA